MTEALDRLDRIKQRQATSRSRLAPATAAPGAAEKRAPIAAPNPSTPPADKRVYAPVDRRVEATPAGFIDVIGQAQADALLADFDAILPVLSKLHGYGEDDIRAVGEEHPRDSQILMADRAQYEAMRRRVRGWMVDVISLGAEHHVDDMFEARCRSVFRQDAMGELTDENGTPYPGVLAAKLLGDTQKKPRRRP